MRRIGTQDLSEYCLLTALAALVALGIFCHTHGGVAALWSDANIPTGTAGTAAVTTAGPGVASSTAPSNGAAVVTETK